MRSASIACLLLLVAAASALDPELTLQLSSFSSQIGSPWDRQAQYTIGNNGLNGLKHTTYPDGGYMWLSAVNQRTNQYIVYRLQRTPTVTGLRIWNYNEVAPTWPPRGAKNVEIFTSIDGVSFTSVWVGVLPMAPGSSTVDFNYDINLSSGSPANYVKVLCKDNYGDTGYVGLSKVKVFGTDGTQDPAVAAYCDTIATTCSNIASECTALRSLVGAPISSGTMSSQAGLDGEGEQVGSLTLNGNSIVVTASGTIGCGAPTGSGCPNTPDGTTVGFSGFLLNGVPRHSLIARIGGNSGTWQYVGKGPKRLTGTGAVEFAFNDDGNAYSDNWGSWNINVYQPTDAIADDCDATQSACVEVHADCVAKVSSCPVV